LRKAATAEDAEQAHILQLEHRKQLQDFYYSKKRVKKKRKDRNSSILFKEALCKKERNHCNPDKIDKATGDGAKASNKKLVMFIGDKGTGVGSTIKRHGRYGGKWHAKLQGRATIVCITNEDFTSQICPYCFHRLVNAKRRATKDGKSKLCFSQQPPSDSNT
jgi:hypothetical protein